MVITSANNITLPQTNGSNICHNKNKTYESNKIAIRQQGYNISQTKKHKLQTHGNMAITSANNITLS